MINEGLKHNLVRLSINARMVEGIYDDKSISVTESQLQNLSKICTANDWIECNVFGGVAYSNLQLTSTGVGVAKSKQMQKDQLKNRIFQKKVSDYIVSHGGLFTLITIVIALVGLWLQTFKDSGNG